MAENKRIPIEYEFICFVCGNKIFKVSDELWQGFLRKLYCSQCGHELDVSEKLHSNGTAQAMFDQWKECFRDKTTKAGELFGN